jgi:Tfp pilus assembly protein PilN
MRPVNLIPPEDRRGESAPTRAGGLAYLVVGILGVILAAVIATSLFSKRVEDRTGDAAALEAEAQATEARAASLAGFVTFQQIHDARVSTVDTLARSRFDWERVMRELALVLPRHVWLTNLTGTVSPDVEVENGASVQLRPSVPGPALELVGCGRSQRDVARLIAALEDIDGVTRVTASRSEKQDSTSSSSSEGTEESTSDECRTRPSIPRFEVVAAFDAVAAAPSSPSADGAAPVAPPAETAPTTETATTETASTETPGG